MKLRSVFAGLILRTTGFMLHFGLVCPAETGHLNTMLPLGQELQRRGHRVTFFGVLDADAKVLAAGLEFRAIGESAFPRGSTADCFAQLGKLRGLAALRYTMSWLQNLAATFLQDAPAVLKKAGVDALLVDQISPEGGTIAQLLNIPFVTVCSALPFNQEDTIPPLFTHWHYNPIWWARLRNQAAYRLTNPFGRPMRELRAQYRQKWKLPPETSFDSPLAILSQEPVEFEFPRRHLPPHFHFTGPYHSYASRQPVSFPFDKLTGQPLIYASMGTLQNRSIKIFQAIANACKELDAQLAISLGRVSDPSSLPELSGSPLVVGYAPQLELLQRATLTLTHAGMNTALESLTQGVPMVAIPVTNDQPGVAARIAWTGTGEVIPLNRVRVSKLRTAIKKVLTDESYKMNALRLQEAIRRAGGVTLAADIVEQAIATGKPVLS
jgi:zeaxanthin glucosyltransferase